MKIIKQYLPLIYALVFIMVLSACASKPEIKREVIIEYTYVKYDIPSKFTTACKPSKPISVEQYSQLDTSGRESYLQSYIVELLGEVKRCDNKVQGINKLIKQQNSLVKESSAIEEALNGQKEHR